jgi:hypothetical protein
MKKNYSVKLLVMRRIIAILKEAPTKCETKVLSENGKPSLITFNEKSTYNRFSKVFKEQLELRLILSILKSESKSVFS